MRSPALRLRLEALALTALFALAACGGGDGGGNLTDPPADPPPAGDDPPPGQPSEGPAPVGEVVYALDNGNRLLMFGTESGGQAVSRLVAITGLPILKRMIDIDFRPANGKLYGVGNDSRVYVIDTLTGAATPVGEPFEPHIISSFDIHFAMDFDPATDRIRLLSNELGGNWSINPDDGTAIAGKTPRYAAGDPHEGERAHIGGFAFIPVTAQVASRVASLSMAGSGDTPCDQLLMAMDTELSQMITSCDPDNGDWDSLGPIEGIESLACVDLDYSGPGGGIWAAGQRINGFFNSIGTVDPESGAIDWKINVPDNFLIQAITFKPKPDGISGRVARAHAGVAPSFSASAAPAPGAVDPVALCRGTGAP